jgi:type II secretory pathway component GspD/PulD (secretin)
MLLRLILLLAVTLSACAGLAQTDQDWIKEKLAQFGRAPQAVRITPKEGKQTFNISGDARRIWDSLAQSFGLQVTYDENIPTRPVQFRLQDVDFRGAAGVAAQMTKTFYVPMTPTEIMVANDTPAKRRELERYVMRTFYFQNVGSPQELNDMVNLLRTVFEVRFLVPSPANNSIEVRAPQETLDAIDRFMGSLSPRPPQVLIDVQVLEVNRSALQNIGINLPLQFQIFNIGAAALAALNSPNLQNLINQLIANGGLNGANSSSIAALIGQLQNQQNSSLSSLLQNPIATFGGGLTLFGVTIPPATINFQRNDSYVKTIEHTTLQAQEGNAANIHIGERLPVLTQSFSSGVQVGNIPGLNVGSTAGIVPGFQYEDLGVTMKATPSVHGSESVTFNLELQVRTAGATQTNGIPIINNREYKGQISVRDGEPAVMAGMITRNESRAVSGLPGVASVPLIGRFGASENNNVTDSELLLIITPHITSYRETSPSMIVMPKGQ